VRYLVLREQYVTLPSVRRALGDQEAEASVAAFEQAEAAWDPTMTSQAAEDLIRDLGGLRFELLQRLEAAPETAWGDVELNQLHLAQLVLGARQHELEHLSAIWRVALYWDRVSPVGLRHAQEGSVGLPLHPADRLQESH
jgi:hypothetical protein